jgi:hypothetical protein
VKRKRAPKFPSDRSLGAIDLDNEVIGTSKSDEFCGICVYLFRRKEIRHELFSASENKQAEFDRPTALLG